MNSTTIVVAKIAEELNHSNENSETNNEGIQQKQNYESPERKIEKAKVY